MFNLSGSEIVFLLLIALIVLGPEALPDAVRKFGKVYGELKKMSSGFQTELKSALDEPMREMRETADAFKKAANLDFDSFTTADVTEPAVTEPEVTETEVTEPAVTEPEVTEPEADEPPVVQPPGPELASPAPQTPKTPPIPEVVESVEESAAE